MATTYPEFKQALAVCKELSEKSGVVHQIVRVEGGHQVLPFSEARAILNERKAAEAANRPAKVRKVVGSQPKLSKEEEEELWRVRLGL